MSNVPSQVLDQVVGAVCTSAQSNAGSMVSIDLESGACSDGLYVHFGEWELEQEGSPIASWTSARNEIQAAVSRLVGQQLVALDVGHEHRSTRCSFDGDFVLTVGPCTYDVTEPWWVLYRDQEPVLEFGPWTAPHDRQG